MSGRGMLYLIQKALGRHWQFLRRQWNDPSHASLIVGTELGWFGKRPAGWKLVECPVKKREQKEWGPGPGWWQQGKKEKRQNLHLIWQLIGYRWIKESSGKMATWVCPGFLAWAKACRSQQARQAGGCEDGPIPGGFRGWWRISPLCAWQEPGISGKSLREANRVNCILVCRDKGVLLLV